VRKALIKVELSNTTLSISGAEITYHFINLLFLLSWGRPRLRASVLILIHDLENALPGFLAVDDGQRLESPSDKGLSGCSGLRVPRVATP